MRFTHRAYSLVPHSSNHDGLRFEYLTSKEKGLALVPEYG